MCRAKQNTSENGFSASLGKVRSNVDQHYSLPSGNQRNSLFGGGQKGGKHQDRLPLNRVPKIDARTGKPYMTHFYENDNQNLIYKPRRLKNNQIKYVIRKKELVKGSSNFCGTAKKEGSVTLCKNHATGNYGYSGIVLCKSVWSCPHCRVKITSRRRDLLKSVSDKFEADGGGIFLFTFTLRHNREENLENIIGNSRDLTGLLGAMRIFRSSKAWRKFKRDYDVAGDVRTIECTYSQKNGWHPHIHMGVYVKDIQSKIGVESSDDLQQIDLKRQQIAQKFKNELDKAWYHALHKADKNCNEHGLDVKYFYQPEYLVKYGIPDELNGHSFKKSKGKGQTMSQLEEDLILPETDKASQIRVKRACKLMSEYYKTMHGRMLTTSTGEIGEMLKATDDELIEQGEKEFKETHTDEVEISKRIYNLIWYCGLTHIPLNIMEQTNSIEKLREWIAIHFNEWLQERVTNQYKEEIHLEDEVAICPDKNDG